MAMFSGKDVEVHSTAIVGENVQIGAGTRVGAGVLIEDGAEVGENCQLLARSVVTGSVRMGDENVVGYGAVIGAEPQDTGFSGEASYVEIGNQNTFREYVTIHRGTEAGSKTVVGNGNFLMVGSHVAHNCVIRNYVFLVNHVLLGGYVEVHDHAFLGGAAVVHQHTRIGEYVMVRGQTRLGLDVPPYCMAVDTNTIQGLNRVGMKRNGIQGSRRRAIQRAFDYVYYQGLNRQQALEAITGDEMLRENEDVAVLVDFLSETTRGISQPESRYRQQRMEKLKGESEIDG